MNRRRVLIVDDTPDILDAIADLIQMDGYETATAADGKIACLQLVAHPDIGLVITDFRMPNMNGIELIGHVRRGHPEVKLILVTAEDDQKVREHAVAAGADAVFIKPISWDDVGPRVAELLP